MNPQSGNIKLEPLAIIGIGCRFPGNVHSLNDLWELLVNKTDAITEYPSSRISDTASLVDKNRERDKIITNRGGFINNVEYFDAEFFNISPLEAEKIDPAQRLLLEVTQESIENAGLTNDQLQGSNTGVFVGNWTSDYEHRLKNSNQDIDVYATTGSGRYALSGRLSYFFNLQGPSLTVDTACSSSIVALNIASQSLNTGECDMAFVGASNTITDFFVSVGYSRSGLLSEYGECRFGDEQSTGYVRSEGAAMIIVKRLSDAIEAGDHIHAVVLSTACNSDGQSHKNLFAPSAATQEVMIRKAIQRSGVEPNDIVYVEAHGTGTKAGDPAEIKSIWNALADKRTKEDKVFAGSIKTNFGHTEAVAGLAGLLKTVASIQHKTILPSLHFDKPNPKIAWNDIGITIPQDAMPWPANKPLIAGINTFGITGTNAHAIITNAPEEIHNENSEVRKDIYLLPLSAKSEQSLAALAKKYAEFISASENPLEDICAMAALHRTHFPVREVFIAKNKTDLVEKLNDFAENDTYESKKVFDPEDAVKTVFVFPGQGAQWIQMGKTLMETELVYKAALDEISSVYKNYVDWDLIEEIGRKEDSSLHEIDIVQPVLVAVEIALANLWMSKGVFPDIVLGHSMGEIAAAYVAGNITLHEAAQIIITRSKLMKQVSGNGEMGATDLTVEEANEILKGYEGRLSVAVMNSKNSTVISGDPAALNEVFAKLEAQGRFNRKVKVDVASHSPQMDEIKTELEKHLQNIHPKNSSVQFYSTAFNAWKNGEELDAAYWANNLRNPVQFGNAIQHISGENNAVYVEMSPHPTLIHAINENIEQQETKAKVVGSFVREKDEQVEFYNSYVELFNSNSAFDWKNIYPAGGRYVELPTYAWQKERYWLEVDTVKTTIDPAIKKIATHFYELDWEEAEPAATIQPKKILLIKDTYGYHQQVQEKLRQKGCTVHVIDLKDDLAGIDADIVIHMRSLYKEETYSYYYDCGIDSLQRIVKHLGDQKIKVCVVTNGAQVLNDLSLAVHDKLVNLNAALLTGLIRTIQNEYSNISFQQIDVSHDMQEIETVAALAFAGDEYRELAIRGKNIFTPVIISSASQQTSKSIAANATYIVTGGNNGLGLETVKWLASRGAKNIAIISRSGLKENAQKEVDALGINIQSYTANVANSDELKVAIEKIRSSQPGIKGVFHAAGILDDTMFENLTRQKFENTLSAKANGAWNLHQQFLENSLDIFVVYSSVTGIIGSAGQSNYAAANTFLDALLHYRKNNHLAGLSVNWGTIGDIGLAAQQENRGNRLIDSGLQPIPSKDLFHYFDKLFLSELPELMAMDINFEKWAENNSKASVNYLYSKVLKQNAAITAKDHAPAFANVAAATKHIKQQIKQTISAVTKINTHKIREDDTFKSYGIDSLLALQIKNKLQKDLDVQLNVSVIWSYPTVNKLADFLVKELKMEEQIASNGTHVPEEIVQTIAEPVLNKKSALENEVENLSLDDLLKQLGEKV